MKINLKPNLKIRLIYLISATVLLSCILYFNNALPMFENQCKDAWLVRNSRSFTPVDTSIVIIKIDDKSLSEYGGWPFSREMHAKLINKLVKYKSKVIAFDVIFSERKADAEGQKTDKELIKAAKKAKNVVLPIVCDFNNSYGSSINGKVKPKAVLYPFNELNNVVYTGHINVFPDDYDGYVRKALTRINYNGKSIKSFAEEIYDLYQGNTKKTIAPTDKFGRADINFAGCNSNDIGRFPRYSYCDILDGKIPNEELKQLKDKIVLVGPYAQGLTDAYNVPVLNGEKMNGVEIHANIIQDYIHNSFKKDVPTWVNLLIIILISFISLFNIKKFSNLKYIIITILAIVGYGMLSEYAYIKGYILTVFYPIFGFILCQIVILAYHYIVQFLERRRVTNIFGRYVDKQIVNKLIANGQENMVLGGEKRFISVLFVDIRGFTPLSESVEPERVVEILNEYLTLTSESIFKFNGTLDKFVGDATMAIYNAPLELEDHAFKAIQSALAMRQGAVELENRLFEKYGKRVKFGIGVNTGYAIVGNIGSNSRMDYTEIGDTVNTSARLEANAKGGEIIISESTYQLVKDRVIVESLGKYKLKGKAEELPVYNVLGLKED